MSELHHTAAALRIMGEDLDPGEISRLLGGEPTFAHRKGDQLVGRVTKRVRPAKSGMWSISVPDREPGDINGQITEILNPLSLDIGIWRGITDRYRADLFCGLFMGSSNDGLCISAESLLALGSRGIEIDFDIYDGGSDEEAIS